MKKEKSCWKIWSGSLFCFSMSKQPKEYVDCSEELHLEIKVNFIYWSAEIPDRSLRKSVGWTEDRVHFRKLSNWGELEEFSKEEWPWICQEKYLKLVDNYLKYLEAVIQLIRNWVLETIVVGVVVIFFKFCEFIFFHAVLNNVFFNKRNIFKNIMLRNSGSVKQHFWNNLKWLNFHGVE